MFTGIVEGVGTVVAVEGGGALRSLVVEAPGLTEGVVPGGSVAVNGCCLTATRIERSRFHFDVVRETLDRTNLGGLQPGSGVHLERALRADGRLDGHLVQGHVDGLGRVRELARRGRDVRLLVACEPALAELLVEKGSVAVDGVSLTVVGVAADGFDVALVPHTLERTLLGERAVGDPLNLEADVLGKYVRRYLERIGRAPGGG